MLYSIVETAVACGTNVYHYLKYLLEEVPKYLSGTELEFLEDMLPWSDAYRSYEADAMSRSALFQNPFHQEAPPGLREKKICKKNTVHKSGTSSQTNLAYSGLWVLSKINLLSYQKNSENPCHFLVIKVLL